MEESRREELLKGWEAMAPHGCIDLPIRMDELARCELFTALAFERLEQKAVALEEILHHSNDDWNQTLYEMLFRTVGDLRNREAYSQLARRIPYRILLRERQRILSTEALLFGASGLLDGCREDDYTRQLRSEFEFLVHKYQIEAMSPEAWRIDRLRPANHPRLRLSQLAIFLNHHEFVIDQVLACRTRKEIEQLFSTDSSHYWSSYHRPSQSGDHSTKRLGSLKAQLIGINLAAPIQYLYGRMTGRDELRHRAIELWEALPGEENRYTRIWAPYRPLNAFESQALLQLAREYCEPHRCRQCPLARRRLREMGTKHCK